MTMRKNMYRPVNPFKEWAKQQKLNAEELAKIPLSQRPLLPFGMRGRSLPEALAVAQKDLINKVVEPVKAVTKEAEKAAKESGIVEAARG